MNRLLVYRWSDWPRLAALAFVYALFVGIALKYLTTAVGHVSMVWIPSGIGLAAILLGGKRLWPGIFLGAWAGYLVMLDRPAWTSAGIALGSNVVEPLMAVALMSAARRWGWRFDVELNDFRVFLLLGVAAVLSASLAAATGCGLLVWSGILGSAAYFESVANWWMGDVLGLVLVTPLILVWRKPPGDWWRKGRGVEAMLCFGLAFCTGQVAFLGWEEAVLGSFAKGFLMFIFVAWSAARFGRHGTLLVIGMTGLQALLGAVKGVGYFGRDVAETGLVNFWFFMLVLTGAGMTQALILNQRRRVEADLRKSEGRFRTMTDLLPQKVWTSLTDGRWDYVNQRVLDFFGAPFESIMGEGWKSFVHPDDLPTCNSRWGESLQSGKPYEFDLRLLHHSGSYRWCVARALPLKDEQGRLVKWYGTNTDITQRKQATEELRRSEMRYRLLTENMKDVVWVLDAETLSFVYVSPSIEALRGYTPEEIMSMPALEPYPPNEREGIKMQIRGRVQAFLSGEVESNSYYTDELEVPCKDGSKVWVEFISSYQSNQETGHVEIHGVTRDISVRKRAQEEMQLASLVYQNSSEGMMVTDADGNILTINPAFTQLTGYTANEVLGKNPRILKSGRHDQAFYAEMWRSLNTTGRWQGEIWNKRKNGELYAVWSIINTSFKPDGSVYRRVALFSDITQKKESDELIWKQANFDPLTGLPNRQMFHDRLEQEIKKSNRTGLPLALILLDLDRFKEINDTLGHDMGDVLLKEAAQRLVRCVRETDTVARLGGDEFTVIMAELNDPTNIERVARAIQRKLTEAFQLGEETAYLSSSMGITLYPADAASIETLIKNADQAMYEAKHQGRDRHCYFTHSMQEAAQARMRMARDLRGALAENQFRLVYQPIVELSTGNMQKAEALIRWQHPQRGLISPAEFISLAAETGILVEIGDWVFREATSQAGQWRAKHHPAFQVSVNRSAVQFQSVSNHGVAWFDYIRELGLPGQSVAVEITEELLHDAGAAVREQLLEFRDAGIQVSLDDFGTGYSSLPYLKKFDIDFLKIDQSFVGNLESNKDNVALCEAIVAMAHKLGMKVVAEGVETEEQRELLIGLGCDFGQGYLFSRPLPAEEFEKLF